jgi:hypothetical protein
MQSSITSGTDLGATAALYDSMAANEADRLRLHPMERALTLDTIINYLESPDEVVQAGNRETKQLKIADIGGATGAYAFALADHLGSSVEVHLRDLSPNLIARANEEQSRREDVNPPLPKLASIAVGSALNPGLFPRDAQGTFDAVLLLGPLYHLVHHDERVEALKIALQLLKPKPKPASDDGRTACVFAAFVPRVAHLRDVARRDPARLTRASDAAFYAQYLADGRYVKPGATPRESRSSYHVGTPNEVRELAQAAGGRVVELIGLEGILGGGLDGSLIDAESAFIQAWVEVMRPLARQEFNLGAADHWLAVIEPDN